MKGVFLPGDFTAVVRDVEVPAPGPGQLLLRVGASGICGSDLSYIYRGHKTHVGQDGPAYKGVVAGHEPSGEVVEAGPGCRRFGVGDRVIVYHIAGCGLCPNCRRGYMISCSDAKRRSSYGWQRDGGHAEYILVEESTCVPLPEELSFIDGALIACGFGTAYEGLLRTRVGGRDDLLVVGLGPVGLAAAMIARGLGASRVLGVERSAERAEHARTLDLFDEVLIAGDTVAEALDEATGGRGCSVTMDCSGSAAGRGVAIRGAAEWGRVSLVGEGGRLETEVSDLLLHRQLTLYASWVTSLPAMEELAGALVRWGAVPQRLVTDVLPLEKADEAYRLADSGRTGKVCLVPALS
ncbi:alcohol dehydrogenase catalytic domain-containing protein [Actinomadura alba]|uniref:Alcohol dehydrogenase catalytic domain-containing protein n=2 Tax=Actinomadura alba TaxID=406431 RepID=A0ABR7LPK6_9ACTN|nr:alcohol dehydrogenase catalytic domain-containing protein [Actinomadura alba]